VQIDPRADENPQLNLFESETPKTPAVGESSP
jgi:hypothetical protein